MFSMNYSDLLNDDSDIDWIAKHNSLRVDGLPGAFVDAFRERRGEPDLDRCLRPGAGGAGGYSR